MPKKPQKCQGCDEKTNSAVNVKSIMLETANEVTVAVVEEGGEGETAGEADAETEMVDEATETLIVGEVEGLTDAGHAIRDHHVVETPENETHIEAGQESQIPTCLLEGVVQDAMIAMIGGGLLHRHLDHGLLHDQRQDPAHHLADAVVLHLRVVVLDRQTDVVIHTEDVEAEAEAGVLIVDRVGDHLPPHRLVLVPQGVPRAEDPYLRRPAHLLHHELAGLAVTRAQDLDLRRVQGAEHHEEGCHAAEKGQHRHQHRQQMRI